MNIKELKNVNGNNLMPKDGAKSLTFRATYSASEIIKLCQKHMADKFGFESTKFEIDIYGGDEDGAVTTEFTFNIIESSLNAAELATLKGLPQYQEEEILQTIMKDFYLEPSFIDTFAYVEYPNKKKIVLEMPIEHIAKILS